MSEKFIVLDVETTNDIDCPICYDIGFMVVDCEGNIYEKHSYVVADVFFDNALMESAYFKDKIPQYFSDIKNGVRTVRRFATIRRIFVEVCNTYHINRMYAFNSRFDYMALNTTERYLTKSKYRYFFPYGFEIYDILKLARNLLKGNTDYTDFCVANNYLTKNGLNRHTAEIVYQFLNDDLTFEEQHCGLEDCEIEYKIFLACDDFVNGKLWD